MLTILLIGIAAGIISILFLLAEIHESLQNIERLNESLRGINKLKMIWLLPMSVLPIVADIAITLFVVWLFGMSGMMGMMISFIASAVISGYLFIRRKRRVKTSLIPSSFHS